MMVGKVSPEMCTEKHPKKGWKISSAWKPSHGIDDAALDFAIRPTPGASSYVEMKIDENGYQRENYFYYDVINVNSLR